MEAYQFTLEQIKINYLDYRKGYGHICDYTFEDYLYSYQGYLQDWYGDGWRRLRFATNQEHYLHRCKVEAQRKKDEAYKESYRELALV